MDLKLKSKRALVTGSSSGIGAAIALELAAEGVSVVVHGRDAAKAADVARQVQAKGVGASVALGDLTSDIDAAAIASVALAAFGGIEILVNCAGGVVNSNNPKWEDVAPEDWLKGYNLNVVSIIRLAQKLTPGMIERGWGRIINISSIAGGKYSGMFIDYGAAKSAVDQLTGNLSKMLAPQGVTVNAVIPGTVLTPQAERWMASKGVGPMISPKMKGTIPARCRRSRCRAWVAPTRLPPPSPSLPARARTTQPARHYASMAARRRRGSSSFGRPTHPSRRRRCGGSSGCRSPGVLPET